MMFVITKNRGVMSMIALICAMPITTPGKRMANILDKGGSLSRQFPSQWEPTSHDPQNNPTDLYACQYL